MEEKVPSVEAYEAAMVLSGVGDALGYRAGRWEYCTSGPQIHAELAELGGLAAITLEPPEWPVSDDTVLHLATAEGLATGLEGEPLLQELARRYVAAMGDMEGRKPGPTSILGTSQLRPGEPEGYRIPFNPRGTGCGAAMRSLAIGLRYLDSRGLLEGCGPPQVPSLLSPAERDTAYLGWALEGWPGRSGHDAPMVALEALLAAGECWEDLCGRGVLHVIEDLTRKTGNFKQFGIFCSMLESALMQSSESVSLELLTYADLETLRSWKVGAVTRPPHSTSSLLSSKRYLILIYSVEFDRIHYPLPLPYAGRVDLATLVRALREELVQLRTQHLEETQHLQDALRHALEEKRVAEVRHQREHQRLAAQLAEAKTLEQRLQLRVKSLTTELASCRRGCGTLGTHIGVEVRYDSPPPHSDPLLWTFPPGSRLPRFDPTAFIRARQQRQKEAELRNQQHRAAFGSTSPARSHRRSSSAESFRSWCSAVQEGDPYPETPEHLVLQWPLYENHSEEPLTELAEIDARLRALQEYMDSLDTHM
ncbi:hypothetical protein WISP_36842 [Willisornis vidua]|uniref:Formamidopyrimidine-DNA glycosylase catalytic domain-containing protein n=1 Tax=Willisornis vidua TaxID=1566151 RepID=A0ABQ9DIX2_9PASS|nr:hypothetical protein WISP_36842 [Willisornis vidua]